MYQVCKYVHACGIRAGFLNGAWSSWYWRVDCLHLIEGTVCFVPSFLVSANSCRNLLLPKARVQTFLCISFSLSSLGWYIQGLSQLPPGQRLVRSLVREFCFCLSFSVSVCTQSTVTWEIAAPSRVFAGAVGRGGVGRRADAVFVGRRCMYIKTGTRHGWTLSGLLVSD